MSSSKVRERTVGSELHNYASPSITCTTSWVICEKCNTAVRNFRISSTSIIAKEQLPVHSYRVCEKVRVLITWYCINVRIGNAGLKFRSKKRRRIRRV